MSPPRLLLLSLCVLLLVVTVHARFTRYFSREVHAFFYLWYGSVATDGKYLHWDHEILQHWTPSIAAQYPKGRFTPPGDIGATYFPSRGLYSSSDALTLEDQMRELSHANVDVVVASWWGQEALPASRDGQNVSTDRCMPALLDAAAKFNLKVAFHLEPYRDRSALSVRDDLRYIVSHYGSHSAFYRHPVTRLPLAYVYDSYLSSSSEWAQVLGEGGTYSIRGTEYDFICLGLLLHHSDKSFIVDSKFDGFYTYFSSVGFTWASDIHRWREIATWAEQQQLIFSPSVGPGYDDTRIRPWNAQNKKDREDGKYYDRMFEKAIEAQPFVISLTSYNEWGEGTQLESAVPFTSNSGEKLADYTPNAPDFYMERTRKWATVFKKTVDDDEMAQHAKQHQHDL